MAGVADTGSSSASDKRSGPPTIKDVAAIAGVSWRTVSNVVNGHKYISDNTRAKVEAAIAELGYRPQLAGRQLRSGRSKLLTLSVPFISHPYFAQLAHSVVREAERHRYDVVIDETRGIRERELQVASGYRKLLTDGILFSPLALDRPAVEAARDKTPLVMLGEHFQSDTIDSVTVDNVRSVHDATNHLIANGRRRIGFLGHTVEGAIGSADLRLRGYREALASAGLDSDPGHIIDLSKSPASADTEGAYSHEEGYIRVRDMIPTMGALDGLVCGNDLLAIGALRAFREGGVSVPEQVAVVGWDNVPEGAYTSPTLTTIAPNLEEIARFAIEVILARLDDPTAPIQSRVASYSLVVRESAPHFAG